MDARRRRRSLSSYREGVKTMRIPVIARAVLAAAAALLICPGPALSQSKQASAKAPYKILYIMSYHSPWRWTDGQLEGFKEGMAGAPAEYRSFQMDAKQNSTPQAKE